MKTFVRRTTQGLVLLVLCLLASREALAQSTGVTFTLTPKSVYARATPASDGQKAASLFQGKIYRVNARSADGLWLRLDYTGIPTEAWVLRSAPNDQLSAASFGSDTKNVLPSPGVELTWTVPFISRAAFETMARPMPVPAYSPSRWSR